MVYDEPPQRMRELVDAKVASQFARAMRYVEAVGARAVVPSAGPPAFLDPELFRFNVIEGDELSIFPDQRSFMSRLDAAGHRGVLAIPGTAIDVTTDSITVTHPIDDRGRRGDLRSQGRLPLSLPGRLDAVAHRDASQLEPAEHRPADHLEGLVGAAAGDGAHAAPRHRRPLLAPRRRPGGDHRLPQR